MRARTKNVNAEQDAAKGSFYDGMSSPLRTSVSKMFELMDSDRINVINDGLLERRLSQLEPFRSRLPLSRQEQEDIRIDDFVRKLALIPGRLELAYTSLPAGLKSAIVQQQPGEITDTMVRNYYASHPNIVADPIEQQIIGGIGTAHTVYNLLTADVYRQIMTLESDPDERARSAYRLMDTKAFTAGCLYLATAQHLETHQARIAGNTNSPTFTGLRAAEIKPETSPFILYRNRETGEICIDPDREAARQYWQDTDESLRDPGIATEIKGCPAGKAAKGPGDVPMGTAIGDYVHLRNIQLQSMQAFEHYEDYMRAISHPV